MASDNKSSGGDQAGFGSWSTGLRFRGQQHATKLLHKKFADTSRFVVSSKVWMNTIPTRDCDILMTFPSKTEDQTLMWLLARLRARAPELAVHVRHHSNTGVYGFYMTAIYENLLKGAEELCIHKPLKSEFGGGTKEFVYNEADCFENVENSTAFFTTQERQSIVKNMLFNLRAVDGDRIGKLTFLEGQALVPFLISRGIVKQVLPLHNTEDLDYLRNNWVQAFTKPQPLGRVCDYFGVKIALYFAYLGHYTKALVIPAFVGLFCWLLTDRDQWWDDWIFVVYSLVNVIWGTLYLEHWKRESAEHAYRWGTLDKEDELLTEPRPLYTGYLVKSKVTGRQEPYYPSWKRNLIRYLVSLPIICACLSVVFVTMLYIFSLQDWINLRIKQGEMPFYFKFLPKIMLALSIGILDDIYKKIAYWLTNLENYRLDETYELNLIMKLVLFQFVNSFLSLFYIAFYLQDMDRLKEQLAALLITRQVIGNIKEALVPWCFEKLKLYRIGYQMTSNMSPDTLERHMQEMTGLSKESLEASLRKHEGSKNESGETTETTQSTDTTNTTNTNVDGSGTEPAAGAVPEGDGETGGEAGASLDDLKVVKDEMHHSGPQLTQAEVEAAMKTYEDTFDDYLEMFIQFGYVTLFSSAFPMAAMSALLNNVIEIRSDAFKLCTTFQRPFGQRVASMGIWQDALEMLALIGVMVNCALIGMSGLAVRLFPDLSTTHRIVAIILLEHAILALKLGIACAIPDVPQWVAEEKARLDFLRREALKKVESKSQSKSASSSVFTESSAQRSYSSQYSMHQRVAVKPSNLAVSDPFSAAPTNRGLDSRSAGGTARAGGGTQQAENLPQNQSLKEELDMARSCSRASLLQRDVTPSEPVVLLESPSDKSETSGSPSRSPTKSSQAPALRPSKPPKASPQRQSSSSSSSGKKGFFSRISRKKDKDKEDKSS